MTDKPTDALEPFATFAEQAVDENGWSDLGLSLKDERIVDWFGPSDFRAALAARTPITSDADGELRRALEAAQRVISNMADEGALSDKAPIFARIKTALKGAN